MPDEDQMEVLELRNDGHDHYAGTSPNGLPLALDDGHNRKSALANQKMAEAEAEEERVVSKQSSIGMPKDKEKQREKLGRMLHQKKSFNSSMTHGQSLCNGVLTTDHMLEEALQMDSRNRFWRAIKKSLGILAISDAARRERRRRGSVNYQPKFPELARAVQSPMFEVCMGILMILNGLLIGVEASFDDTPTGEHMEAIFELFEHFFTGIFVVELGVRLLVHGWTWILDLINAMDTTLILFTGVLPMWILSPLGHKSDFVRLLQVLRILRLVRLIRMFRTVSFLRTGYKLTSGLVNGGTIIFHTYVMIVATLYVFAVFSVYLVGRSKDLDDSVPEQKDVKDLFRTVPAAMFTLFDFITLNDWTEVVRPTQQYTSVLLVLAILVIMVMTLVLNNLITAVIVTHALSGIKEDTELMAAEKRHAEEVDIRDLRHVFRVTPKSDPDRLTKVDFFNAMGTPDSPMRNKLGGMQIAQFEAEEAWDLLEAPREGIDEDDFCHGLRALKGEALAKDSFAVAQHIRRINARMSRLSARLAACKQEVDRIRNETAITRKDMGTTLMEVQQFISYIGVCVPLAGISKTPKHMTGFQQKRLAWRCQ